MRILVMPAERPSVETMLSLEMMRLRVTERLMGFVLLTDTPCVVEKVSRTRSLV